MACVDGRAIGVDKAKGGWVVVELESGRFRSADFVARLEDLDTGDAGIVAIDMPLEYPVQGRRTAEVEARRRLGRRAATVFFTPPAEVVSRDWDHARRSGVSKQMWNLVPFVDEARSVVTDRWIETHPEVVFAALAGEPLAPKRSWNGSSRRRELLEAAGVVLPSLLGRAGDAAVDDVLDAAACAVVAHLHPRSTEGLGIPAETQIWVPRSPRTNAGSLREQA